MQSSKSYDMDYIEMENFCRERLYSTHISVASKV